MLFPFVVFSVAILIVSQSFWSWVICGSFLFVGLDDEWVDPHSEDSDKSYTAEQWSSAGWGDSWDMSEFCEDGGLLSPCESFHPSLALEFWSRCSNVFILGLVKAVKKAIESSSIGFEEDPIVVE